MRVFRFALACILLTAVSCTTTPPAIAPSPTTVSQTILPTEAAVPPTTTIEPIVAATETAVSLPTNTPTPTLPPPPEWILYFLWDSENIPSGLGNPVQKLYRALPSVSLENWQLEPVLENLVGQPQSVLSLDKTILAITPLEDRNGDGDVSMQGYARGFDGLNIYTYSFPDDSFERVTDDFPRSLITVLQGNKILTQYNTREFWVENSAGVSAQQLTTPISDSIHWIKSSPNRSFLAVNLASAQLQLIDTQSGEIKRVTNDIGGFPVESAWSPDSQWLAVAQPVTGHFFLVDTITAEATQIPDFGNIHSPTWSPDGDRLLLIREIPNGSELLFFDIKTQIIDPIASISAEIRDPQWSPDGKHIAFATKQDEGIGLELLNLADNSLDELWFAPDAKRAHIFSWSPDSQWLLFHVGQEQLNIVEDESGLYILHKDSRDIFQILDSSGKYDPYGFIWLEN